MDIIKRFFSKKKPNQSQNHHHDHPVSSDFEENVQYIEDALYQPPDLKKRNLRFNQQKGVLIYLDTLTDKKLIQSDILRPLFEVEEGKIEEIIPTVEVKQITDLNLASENLLRGKCILFLQGVKEAYAIDASAMHKRDMSEPENEGVVRGAHNGFTEQLTVNLYSLRTRLENPNLTVRYFDIGRKTKTRFALVFMRDLAAPKLVQEIEERLQSISTDTIVSIGFIADYMEDHPNSPFPQSLFTERPDRTVANLMEGRVAILGEGDPTAVILPVTFFAFYQSPDDYNNRWIVGSFIRLIRLASLVISFQLPAIYIAVVSFHPEVMPVELIYSVRTGLERIPFPPIVEAGLMELTLEVIREAGLRLPSRVGQTIGIVGGLVIGEAVVQAGLISYTMVIVIAITAISSFVVPSHEMSTTIQVIRFPLMLTAATFGFMGIMFGVIITLIHLCKIHSVNTPYIAPVAPLRIKDLKDTFVRFPLFRLNERPHDPHPQQYKQESESREWARDDQGKK
ncbi:spore germination protein [Desmospora activa]|nr:spore germination protein [Desmospora activa]